MKISNKAFQIYFWIYWVYFMFYCSCWYAFNLVWSGALVIRVLQRLISPHMLVIRRHRSYMYGVCYGSILEILMYVIVCTGPDLIHAISVIKSISDVGLVYRTGIGIWLHVIVILICWRYLQQESLVGYVFILGVSGVNWKIFTY